MPEHDEDELPGLRAAVDVLADAGLDDSLSALRGWDSLAVLMFIAHCEQVRGFVPTGAQVRSCRTPRDLLALIRSHQK